MTTPPLPLHHASQDQPSTTPQPSPEDYNTQIDALLTRYLFLLNEYTTLRSSLSSLQSGMYQNLARANFAAERGMRYGKEYFDERMVAGRRLRVLPREARGEEDIWEEGNKDKEEEKVLEWRVVKVDEDGNKVVAKAEEKNGKKAQDETEKENTTQQEGNEAKEQDQDKQEDTTNPETDRHQKEDTSHGPQQDDGNEDAEKPDDDDKKNKIKKIRNDPLRWFGLLTPLPLRQAQTQAIQAVEQIIPRLVTVNTEMAQVEIEVRRARKRREKATVKAKAVGAEGVVGASA
ncbi:hypothetical protein QBC32DRAFT_329667 [Pseudoneurospora amorphoporcata]|uniref:Vacuolar ATPase assembly protein VMA22 n=1 Tax=Pseudoneurospora amorphoporcata TaxID=241081 RepID=A0AAN6P4Z1_9PEZI|nr:hypothetical protein QBC32DRAFT_329667 [Pseudoneurospora amorphoporcata]